MKDHRLLDIARRLVAGDFRGADVSTCSAWLAYDPVRQMITCGTHPSLSVKPGVGLVAYWLRYDDEATCVREAARLCGIEWTRDSYPHGAGRGRVEEIVVPWLTFLAGRARLQQDATVATDT